MRSLMAAWIALAAVACGGAAGSAAVEMHERVQVGDLPPVDVRVRIQPEHRSDADRYLRAAVASVRTCEEWLGPFPRTSLTIVDPVWRSTPDPAAGPVVVQRIPWWTTRSAMATEIATARAVSRRCWSELLGGGALPAPLFDAFVEYTARRVVGPLFERQDGPPGYRFLEVRYFGGFVPRFVRVRRLPETDDRDRGVLVLGTLERWLGSPVFDEVVAEFVRTYGGRAAAVADLERVASDVSGQNLSWFFDQTLQSTGAIDYGIERLVGSRQEDGSYLTTVVGIRYGAVMFTGSSAPRVGPFEQGRAIMLRVTFADGAEIVDHWDGRDRERTFSYRSSAPAIAAEIDPARVLLLDLNRTNNSRTMTPQGGAVATRWAGRWLIWMQDLLLTYASLV